MAKMVLALGVFFVVLFGAQAFAQEADQIQAKISDQQKKIAELEKEIATFEKELTTIGGEKRTLESAVRELDVSRKKVSANINLEEQKINALEKEIATLDTDIGVKEEKIGSLKTTLTDLLEEIHTTEEQTIVEKLLNAESMGDIWSDMDAINQVNVSVKNKVDGLQSERTSLEESRKASDAKRLSREGHQKTLVSQKRALDVTKQEKKELLTSTNAKESAYQKQLAEKRAAKEEFEAGLRELEDSLEYIRDPSRIPSAGKGVLAWPLAQVSITQKYGITSFSQSGGYGGKPHNGVDFRASIGTPVLSTLSGSVVGTGNTDGGGCYSYGRWVLIRHNNGLSTLYAHLSSVMVSTGQSISTGEIIGLSGATGYATGPHLHLSLFASDGVQVKSLGDWYRDNGKAATTACAKRNVAIPVASPNAYLDPLEYL